MFAVTGLSGLVTKIKGNFPYGDVSGQGSFCMYLITQLANFLSIAVTDLLTMGNLCS